MKNILFSIWRVPILYILYAACTVEERFYIENDINESMKWDLPMKKYGIKIKLPYELLIRKSSRNVFYYRTRNHKFLTKICKVFFPAMDSVEIGAKEIGFGLTIPHGGVVLYANRIGKNCHVCPGVVVGQISGGEFPTIGDNVLIGANASIIGNVKIGNCVKIGAGALVVNDVPDFCTVLSGASLVVCHKNQA